MSETIRTIDLAPTNEVYTGFNKNIVGKAKNTIYQIFILGDEKKTKQFDNVFWIENPTEIDAIKTMVKIGLFTIYNHIPDKVKNKLREKAFETLPISIPELDGFRSLKKVGYGGMNSVFLIKNSEGGSFSLALNKNDFENETSALTFAQQQKDEYTYFKKMFSSVPDFIKNETYVVYKRYDNKPSIMFIREFVAEPLKDFFDIDRNKIKTILTKNTFFKTQLLNFISILLQHKNDTVDRRLDILGKHNLAVIEKDGLEKLILLDPHTTSITSPNKAKRMEERIQYLEKIFKESSTTN